MQKHHQGDGHMDIRLTEQINRLSIAERILLVEEIWDSIARENESFDLTQSQRDELDRRLASFKDSPAQGRTWEEIKAEFMSAR
jgi:putative addiction module component (TIGR02574 family)